MNALTIDRAFRAQVRHLCRLGARPVGELLGEVATAVPAAAPVIAERLEVYGRLDPHTVLWFGANDWLEPTALVRVVAGGGR